MEFLIYLTIKHFIVDALLQTPYQYLNKGKFLHPGGLLHSLLHGIATCVCFIQLDINMIIILGFIDMITHYLIDYIKVNITKFFKWSEYISECERPHLKIYSNKFFVAIVFDQCLHFMTYIALVSFTI